MVEINHDPDKYYADQIIYIVYPNVETLYENHGNGLTVRLELSVLI